MTTVAQHIAAALDARITTLGRNGVRAPAGLVAVRDAFRDMSRQAPTNIAGDSGPDECVPMPIAMTSAEVAEQLRVSQRTTERLIAAGEIRSVLVGRSRRILPDDLREYLSALPKTGTE